MEYLEERYPERPLLPADPRRALARGCRHRFDEHLGDDYYAFRRGDANELASRLEELEVGESLFVDIAYVPWVIRARDMLGVELPARLARGSTGSRSGLRSPPRSSRAAPVSDIEIDELAARLGEVPVLDVRTTAEYDGTAASRATRARGTSRVRATSTSTRLMELDRRRCECGSARAGRRGRGVLPQRLALGDRDADAARARLRRPQLRRLVARVVAHDDLPIER